MDLNGKNVLITGADGFIGSHLTEELLRSGCNVKALSYYNSFNSWGWLEEINHENLEVICGDVRDPYFCKKLTQNIDIVFHLASLIAIPYSYVAPDSYIDTNIKGTANICLAALENNCEKIIHTSTSEVYGTAQYVPIDEKHPLQPQSPYSASKIAADSMAMSFYNAFNLPLIIARPFNTYGPRQSARAIIPTIITQIVAGKKQVKLGDVTPTRDLNYVKDICHGFVLLAETENITGETINIGSNTEISIQNLLEKIKKLMDSDVEFITEEQRIRPEKSEVKRLWCDNSKIRNLTGFKPEYNLEQGLEETIKWFTDSKNLKRYKTDIYNV
ncbi:MAG: NAD-dependent dehydratase [Candidatus Melainabacteria bacterium GWF2_37_15]|nr:MAG: NAD-dependent dehydratase [Candidatus Melainabacteria bacterium GWF2_37_15]